MRRREFLKTLAIIPAVGLPVEAVCEKPPLPISPCVQWYCGLSDSGPFDSIMEAQAFLEKLGLYNEK